MERLVIAQVAALTHRLEVARLPAQGLAAAGAAIGVQVGHGEHDPPARPHRGLTLPLVAAPWTGMRPVQAALALAFAAPL